MTPLYKKIILSLCALLIIISVGCGDKKEQRLDANAHFNLGLNHFRNADYDQAISSFDKAIEMSPMLAEAYYNRGLTYQKKGMHDLAVADYSRTIELDPNDADAYNNRGLVYSQIKKQYDKALYDFKKAIDLNPKYGTAYNNLAITYYFKKDYTKAWDNVREAQELGHQIHPGFLDSLRSASK